jgi:hypothetical protein
MTNAELLDLLREARNALSHGCWNGSCCAVRARIDAALVERQDSATEVERLKAREESLVQQSVAQIGLSGRLQEEVERLKAENIKQFRQGAELMQSAILYILNDYNIDPQAIADIVQMDYPVRPEDWAKRPRSET